MKAALFALVVACLFLIVNRPAYRAFFAEDDLDNLSNARDIRALDLARTLTQPRVTGGDQFRGTTYAFYWAMFKAAGLHYVPYVAAIHLIHLLNVLLVFLLARALGAESWGAGAAALFYVFHAAAFDIYWKPMYAFDLICATFTLLALACYVKDRWIWALVFFWLSLRAKEVTIFFPLVLAAWETLLGNRNWKRLIPFFLLSAAAGIFAMLDSSGPETPYTFHFTWAAVAQTVRFYSQQLAGFAWGGVAILAIPFLTGNRRVCFGLATFLLLLGPMLFLPGRLFAAYLYVPMIGLALALAAVKQPAWLALGFALWIPWNYRQFRDSRNVALAQAYERHSWFQQVADFFAQHPATDTVIWDGAPASVPEHYITGAARLLRNRQPVRVTWVHRITDEAQQPNLLVLVWDEARRKLNVLGRQPDVPYVLLNETAPLWQLTSGWGASQGHLRWSKPRATVRLARPKGAVAFEIGVNEYGFDPDRPGRLDLTLNGAPLGSAVLNVHEPRTFRFRIPPASAGSAEIGLTITPAYHDATDGDLGQPFTGLGFVTK